MVQTGQGASDQPCQKCGKVGTKTRVFLPSPGLMKPSDYGSSALPLEQLRRLVETCAPLARFGGWTNSGATTGEYRFKLMQGRSAYVQAPLTPRGRERDSLGLWKYCVSGQPWRRSQDIGAVVEFIRTESEKTGRD